MEPLAIPPAVLELSETISQATSAIDQTLVEGPQEETRKKLKEELNTLNDTINAFTTNDDCQEEYRERLHKLEPMCSQGGAITQAVQLVGKIVLPSPDARENKAFPLSQEDMVRYILEVKMCKRAIADALSGDFDACVPMCLVMTHIGSHSMPDPRIWIQKVCGMRHPKN